VCNHRFFSLNFQSKSHTQSSLSLNIIYSIVHNNNEDNILWYIKYLSNITIQQTRKMVACGNRMHCMYVCHRRRKGKSIDDSIELRPVSWLIDVWKLVGIKCNYIGINRIHCRCSVGKKITCHTIRWSWWIIKTRINGEVFSVVKKKSLSRWFRNDNLSNY